jgi:hypothetical protein
LAIPKVYKAISVELSRYPKRQVGTKKKPQQLGDAIHHTRLPSNVIRVLIHEDQDWQIQGESKKEVETDYLVPPKSGET